MSQTPLWNDQGIVIEVYGDPQPKGSMKLVTRGAKGMPIARPLMVADNSHDLQLWSRHVQGAALAAVAGRVRPIFGHVPLAVDVAFALERPRSVKRAHPHVRPDLDKLVRAALDPLHGLVFPDDACIVQLHASKRYAKDPMALGYVGARIEVWPLRPKED